MSSYQYSAKTFTSSKDGFSLYCQSWLPHLGASKVIVLQHGFGEHSSRYSNLLDFFSGSGYAFYALDARGHGRSGGKRGDVQQFQLYADDFADLIRLARKEQGDRPLFLCGHSMGAVIVLQCLLSSLQAGGLDLDIKGLLLASPALIVEMDTEKRIKRFVAALMASLMPAATVAANLETEYLSRDKAAVEAYRNDPLIHGRISFRMATTFFRVGEQILANARRLSLPIVLFQGSGDRIVSPEGARLLYENISSRDKTLKMYEGFYHELINEPPAERQEVLGDFRKWLASR